MGSNFAKDFLQKDEFLGVRTSVKSQRMNQGTNTSAGLQNKGQSPTWSSLCPTSNKSKQGESKILQYSMTSRPKGIAVIVVIEKFAHLDQLDGIKKDIDNCTKAFEVLQFKVYPCKDNTADQIIEFIENIANDDHSQYDCFILYFSTHGGNGFVCCSDFQTKSLMKKHKNNASKTIGQNNTPKGFILFDTLFELFVNSKCQSLKEKPKLFFFDCCRQTNKEIAAEIQPSPIRAFDTHLEKDEYYSDIFIGYGAALENSSFIGPKGSFYTEILTNHLKALTLEDSFVDMMTQVDVEMKKTKKFSKHISYLQRKLVLGGKNTGKKESKRSPFPCPCKSDESDTRRLIETDQGDMIADTQFKSDAGLALKLEQKENKHESTFGEIGTGQLFCGLSTNGNKKIMHVERDEILPIRKKKKKKKCKYQNAGPALKLEQKENKHESTFGERGTRQLFGGFSTNGNKQIMHVDRDEILPIRNRIDDMKSKPDA